MTDTSNLIICPMCAKVGKKQILGRLLPNGQFLVLRFHHGTTIIQSTQYSIVCGCGYQVNITMGQISVNEYTPVAP